MYGRAAVGALALLLALGCNFQEDMEDARSTATRFHQLWQAGDYESIYNEAAPRFRTVGTQEHFVLTMQNFERQTGPLRTATETAYQTGFETNAGKVHLLVYELEFERARSRETLMLNRSESGRMQLYKLDVDPPTLVQK